MTVHKTYTIGGKEYHARDSGYRQWKGDLGYYRISRDHGEWAENVGTVTKWAPRRFRVMPFDSTAPVAEHCTSLKEAVTAMALELDRRAAYRKETEVSWGDLIVPRVERVKMADGEIRHFVYDAGRPKSNHAGEVREITSGKWKGKWKATLWGDQISIRGTLAAGVQDIVDVYAKQLRPPYQLGDEASGADDDEEGEGRPDDAITCPLFDTPWDHDDCEVCGGRGWVGEDHVEVHLGHNRVPCVRCGGEGGVESGGPVTWTCPSCLGTGLMPVVLLDQFDLSEYNFDSQDWSDADLGGQNLREVRFYDCNFSGVNFEGADLSNTTFEECQFSGANLELAASVQGTELLFEERSEELSMEQLAACIARGAIVTDEEDEPAG